MSEPVDLSRVTGAQIEETLDRLIASRVGPHTRMRCKVCGCLYDPDEGVPQWSIPPGTPFTELDDSFQCPDCGHPKSAFLPEDDPWG